MMLRKPYSWVALVPAHRIPKCVLSVFMLAHSFMDGAWPAWVILACKPFSSGHWSLDIDSLHEEFGHLVWLHGNGYLGMGDQ
jgi:hypothetical protein